MPFFVNMNDKLLSGWGGAANGRSIYCVQCDTYSQARAIEKAALARSEMQRVAIADKPRKGRAGDHVRVVSVSDIGGPWLQYMTDKDLELRGAREDA